MSKNSYTPKFKFSVVTEAIKGDRKGVEIARAYDIHPSTLSNWKQEFEFKDKGPKVFGEGDTVKEYEKKISNLEQMLGKKKLRSPFSKILSKGL